LADRGAYSPSEPCPPVASSRRYLACRDQEQPQTHLIACGAATGVFRHTDPAVAELIGWGVDSGQAIRWLIALMVLCAIRLAIF
jgi:hypothetical protein